MKRDVLKARQIQIVNCVDKRFQLGLSQRGELNGPKGMGANFRQAPIIRSKRQRAGRKAY
jgi:hypothetical protein